MPQKPSRRRRLFLAIPVAALALSVTAYASHGGGGARRAAPASSHAAAYTDPDLAQGGTGTLRDDDAYQQMEWYYQQRAYPHRTIPRGAWLRSLSQRAQVPVYHPPVLGRSTAAAPAWTSLGPTGTTTSATQYTSDNGVTSGRVTALAYDSTNSILYAGAADGGLWKTTNGGTTWQPLSDTQPSLAVGSIALDPNNPQIIYVGTGEDNANLDAYYGAGLLKSTNGGASWTQFGQTVFTQRKISKVVVDPHNSQDVLVGDDLGLYRSTDGGQSWTQVLGAGAPAPVSDIVLDTSTNPTTVYAAVGYVFGTQTNSGYTANGIYKSTDGGQTFAAIGTGYPTGAAVGRIALAISPSTPSTLYMTAASPQPANVQTDPKMGTSMGVWRSTDSGATWTQTVQAQYNGGPDLFGNDQQNDHSEQQGWYDIYIAVDPSTPSTIYIGGINIFKSTDGGNTFADITNVYTSRTQTIHPDQHAFVFYGTATPRAFYAGNDGGVYGSTDGGTTWSNNNGNLAITQFYGGSTTANFGANAMVWGGAQDNGTQKYTGSTTWTEPYGGDGGFTANDPNNPDTAYQEYTYLQMHKTTDGGNNWSDATNGINLTSNRALFIAPFIMDPTNVNRLLAGTDMVYETTDGASTWKAISPSLPPGNDTQGSISALAIAPSAPQTIYAGTNDGHIWVTTNDGGNWNEITGTGNTGTAGRYVTSLAVNPTNAQDVVVTFSGFSGGAGGTHVYRSTNGGASWTDISATLPDSPVQSAVRDPNQPNAIYIGADDGFFFTTDGGTTWTQYQTGLPNAGIDQLFTDSSFSTFIVATHGRGMFSLPTSAVAPAATAFTVTAPAGWSLVGLPGPATVQASDLLKGIVGTGQLAAIYSLSNGAWSSPVLDLNGTIQGNSFPLQSGVGYLVYSAAGGSYAGTLTQAPSPAPTWTLGQGWNLVTPGSATPQASAVVAGLLGTGKLAAIYSLSGGAWSSPVLDVNGTVSGNRFQLQPGVGYLVYVDHAENYTPSVAAPGGTLRFPVLPGGAAHVVLPGARTSRGGSGSSALPPLPRLAPAR